MKIKYLLFPALLLLISVPSSFAASQQLFIVARMDSSVYAGEVPVMTGKIVDQFRKPVPDVLVEVSYPSETVSTTSSEDGTFKIAPTKPASIGDYGISITGTKDGYEMAMSVMEYSVLEKPPEIPAVIDAEGIQKGVQDMGEMMVNGLTRNPLAEMLAMQMDLAQKQQEKLAQMTLAQKKSDMIDEQRKIVNDSLQQDLAGMEEDIEFYNPFNAFSRFVSDVDSSVQSIFWGQFNLTEQQHIKAREAKMKALEDHRDSKDAMRIYTEKAAVSRDTIIQLNNDLNVRYSNSDNYTQGLFDSQGKLRK